MSELAFTTLAALADITMGQSPDSALCNTNEQGLPFLQGCAEFGQKNPKAMVFCESTVRTAKAGSVLISVRAPVGTMNYADQDYCVGRGLAAFKANPSLSNSVFLKHAVELNSGYLHRRSQGSTFAAVSSEDIRKIPVPKFPLAQQNQIAGILDGIDTAIEKTEALIEKYQQIKAGLMHDLFTRGVLPDGKLRPTREQVPELYRETGVGWIPKEWSVARLEEAAEVSRGKFTHRPRNDPEYYGGEFPFIQTGDVSNSGGGIIEDYSQALSHLGTKVSQCFPQGTIAITIAANIADTGILGAPMYFPDSVVGAVVSKEFNARFIELCIRRSKSRLDSMAPQSAQKNINLQDLRPLKIPIPSRQEQDSIAEIFDAVQKKIDKETLGLENFSEQKHGLMHDLLTGKVAVKVDGPIEQEA